MSGGAFDYQQYKIGEIADQIEEEIRKESSGLENEWGEFPQPLKPETISRMKDAVTVLRVAEVYAQRVDWFLSGDDGEESFHERLEEDLAALRTKE